LRTSEQVRWDFVQSWLKKASQDLRAASILVEEEFDDYNTSAFHAQQASEKFLKAFLVRHQVEFPKTHDIKELRDLSGTRRSEVG
jgi:HEPN domain-containing protein